MTVSSCSPGCTSLRHSGADTRVSDTANKIMTGNSNGTVALYDVEKTGSKLERLKTHHQSGRGINVVSFGGPSGQGTLLASGCQDGDIKISVSCCDLVQAGKARI